MIMRFCDMCGMEITNQVDAYELNEDDFPLMAFNDGKRFFGKELCEDCYYHRLKRHENLDLELFNEMEE